MDRCLSLLVLLISANGVVISLGQEAIYLTTLAVLLVVWIARGWPLTRRDVAIVGAFTVISVAHVAMLGASVAVSSAGFLVRLAVAVLAARAIPSFHRHYVELMVWAAALSLIFFVPVALGVDLARILAPLRLPTPGSEIRHIGLHNFHLPEESHRNSGFFGEPGMFAGYLVLAMLLAVTSGWRPVRWKWALLVVAVLSTQSTTGYMAFAGVLGALLAVRRAGAGRRFTAKTALGVALASAVAVGAFVALPFLGPKIEQQLAEASERTDAARINRIGNLLHDMESIAERPLLGWSPRTAARTELDVEAVDLASGQGNGLSGFAAKFGLVGLGLFLAATWLAFRSRGAACSVATLAVGVVAVLLVGEQFLNASLFLTLMVAGPEPGEALPHSSGEGACAAGAPPAVP